MRIQYGDEPVKDAVKEVNQDDVIESTRVYVCDYGMCVHMCMCVHVCILVCIVCVYVFLYTCMCMCLCIHVWARVCVRVCACILGGQDRPHWAGDIPGKMATPAYELRESRDCPPGFPPQCPQALHGAAGHPPPGVPT